MTATETLGRFVAYEYRRKIDTHLADLRDAQAAGMGYCLLMTERPLDAGLGEYLTLRGGRN
jgi:hypothetical protein